MEMPDVKHWVSVSDPSFSQPDVSPKDTKRVWRAEVLVLLALRKAVRNNTLAILHLACGFPLRSSEPAPTTMNVPRGSRAKDKGRATNCVLTRAAQAPSSAVRRSSSIRCSTLFHRIARLRCCTHVHETTLSDRPLRQQRHCPLTVDGPKLRASQEERLVTKQRQKKEKIMRSNAADRIGSQAAAEHACMTDWQAGMLQRRSPKKA